MGIVPSAPSPFGILGQIHPYYRKMLFVIYDEFGNEKFTCNDIQNTVWMKNFKCQKLRAWHNAKILRIAGRKKGESGGSTIAVWRFTNAATQILRNPFIQDF